MGRGLRRSRPVTLNENIMVYRELLKKAIPYYKKGRTGDVRHIQWLYYQLLKLRPVIKNKGYDFDILFALTILHDVGYSRIQKPFDPFDLPIRKLHAQESARIAREILNIAGFIRFKRKKTFKLIREHDAWAFKKPLQDPEWRIFSDLDFIWETSREGFDIVRRFLHQNRREFLNTVKQHYKNKKVTNPFFLSETEKLFIKKTKSHHTLKGVVCDRLLFLGLQKSKISDSSHHL